MSFLEGYGLHSEDCDFMKIFGTRMVGQVVWHTMGGKICIASGVLTLQSQAAGNVKIAYTLCQVWRCLS